MNLTIEDDGALVGSDPQDGTGYLGIERIRARLGEKAELGLKLEAWEPRPKAE